MNALDHHEQHWLKTWTAKGWTVYIWKGLRYHVSLKPGKKTVLIIKPKKRT